MNDLELIRNVKRDLIRMRDKIDSVKTAEGKRQTVETYVKLLTSLEISSLNSPQLKKQACR